MSGHVRTEEEAFWAGEFGNQYIQRNGLTPANVARRLGLWASILRNCSASISSVLELGANIGLNLSALSQLLPQAELTGLEINAQAAGALRNAMKLFENDRRGGG